MRSGDHPRLPPFQTLVDEHRNDVWRFLVALVGPARAEDCFQETFLAALRAYPRLANGRNLRAWVLTIAHRKALDAVRRRARHEVPLPAASPSVEASPDGDPDLWCAVRALPTKQRAAVVHRFVGDLAYREIAELMSCSEEAARRSVHEGVKRLREVLQR